MARERRWRKRVVWLGSLSLAVYLLIAFLGPRTDYVVPRPAVRPSDVTNGPQSDKQSGSPHKIALLLSGGGYRAMLFHLGALWRLNEAGLLPSIEVMSSVSGGSITAAVVGSKWSRLKFDDHGTAQNFVEEVVAPVRNLANHTLDLKAVALGLLPFNSASRGVIGAYRSYLFGHATLQDLPDHPALIIHATNMQSGFGWTFSKRSMGDGLVGIILDPTVELAVAVAASSAFPPFLSPVILKIDPAYYAPPQLPFMFLHRSPYTNRVFLTDGGVHDNLGFFSGDGFDVLMVSDAGSRATPRETPLRDWLSQAMRVFDLIYEQPALSRLGKLEDQIRVEKKTTYVWSIYAQFDPPPFFALRAAPQVARALSQVPTRLQRISEGLQKQLINVGYAVTGAELLKIRIYPGHSPAEVERLAPYWELPPGKGWPYPECELRGLAC